jgi:hypothetical protein
MSHDEIVAYVERMEGDVKTIKRDLMQTVWHMRGGISYSEAHMLSNSERNIVADIVKDHMDVTNKTHLPYF